MTLKLRYIWLVMTAALLLTATTSCSDELFEDRPDGRPAFEYNEDGSLTIGITTDISDLQVPATRAMGDTPDYDALTLYLLVFDADGFLRQTQAVTERTLVDDTEHAGRKLVQYQATLYPLDSEATIHLIATSQPNLEAEQIAGKIARKELLHSLYTANNNEAYWSRVPLGVKILSKDEDDSNETNAKAIVAKLSHVPMVRNFARVSVGDVTGDFRVTGLYLYNALDRGAMVPYIATDGNLNAETRENGGFVQFFDRDASGKAVNRSYKQISATGYIGEPHNSATLLQEPIYTDAPDARIKPEIYFYERPYRTTNRSFAVIKGQRSRGANNWSEDMYYKVDFIYTEENDPVGEAIYYNLIRNFDYHININSVNADGYSTADAAANGMVYNNLTASIEVRDLTSISNGDETIIVNKTNYVFTKANLADGFEIIGKYLIKGTQDDSRNLKAMITSPETGFLEFGTTNGGAAGAYANGEKRWTVKVKDGIQPSATPRQQTVYIYRGEKGDGTYGLYRIITFTLIDSFQILHIDTFPGLWSDYAEAPWHWTDQSGVLNEMGQGVDAPLTLFFELQDGLPESIFPLEFTIESNRQNIQNAYVGNAVVKTVPPQQSLFWNGGNGGVSSARIQFVKTVTWEDYNTVGTTESPATGSRIVRCRFLTTTDLAQDGIGQGTGNNTVSYTSLRVYNPYFPVVEDEFMRSQKTSDPSPHIWDFCDQSFAELINLLATNHPRLTLQQTFNYLQLQEGADNSIKAGLDDRNYEYITLTNNTDRFYYPLSYDGATPRTLRLEIMCTQENGANPTNAPRVQLGTTDITSVSLDTSTQPYPSYIYEYQVPAAGTAVTANVSIFKPTNATLRFYKISLYPRGLTE